MPERPIVRAYLSLGSNMGDRLAHLVRAIKAIATRSALVAVSPVYETAPLGADGAVVDDQEAFLNCAVAINTALDAASLRAMCAGIEQEFGRKTGERWQPRPIDIDLVLYGNERIELPGLIVPHPRMFARAFVIRPLVDIDPHLALPDVGRLTALLPRLVTQGCVLHTSAAALLALVSPG